MVKTDVHRNTAAVVPEPEGRQPHYWQARVYHARPNYRWDPSDASQRNGCRFNLYNWQHPECQLSPDAWKEIRDTAQRQLADATAKTREEASVKSVVWQYPPMSLRDRASYIAWRSGIGGLSIELEAGSKAVLIAGQENMNMGVRYSIAMTLYDKNCEGLVSVGASPAAVV